ncbi:uncharacterized protein LOC119550239 [Drosophila subpulchrella]|uniref:uncharacterized protein LOC119550239 n=1 Tax=Drosophila subpulchrella TaxID=1486046 RepID=UPI0018A188E4|nr:uncharacterized protein LOC119550239 [Drosophila subpulchrella]
MSAAKFRVTCSTLGWAMRMIKSFSVNPYFVFLAQFRSNLQKRGIHQLKPTSIAKIAGRKWREMTPNQKSVFIEIAKINGARIKKRARPSVPVGGVRRCRIKGVPKNN